MQHSCHCMFVDGQAVNYGNCFLAPVMLLREMLCQRDKSVNIGVDIL